MIFFRNEKKLSFYLASIHFTEKSLLHFLQYLPQVYQVRALLEPKIHNRQPEQHQSSISYAEIGDVTDVNANPVCIYTSFPTCDQLRALQ